jgi:regulatory protein
MTTAKPRRERPPLDETRLQEQAIRYVGRFATTRAKLVSYLRRKVRERGWAGEGEPDLDGLAERFASLGYIDDTAFALSKSRSLTARGYGKGRLDEALRSAGVADEDSLEARQHAETERVAAALRFAARKRIGPFAPTLADPRLRERLLGSMIRAGHAFALSRAILSLEPGAEPSLDELAELSSRSG